MTRIRAMLALLGSLAVAGCQAVYQPVEGHEPFGYRDWQIGEHLYQVSYEGWRGRHYTRLQHWATYRAAGLGHTLGYHWMSVLDVSEVVEERVVAGVDQIPVVRHAEGTSYAAYHYPGPPMHNTVTRVTLTVAYLSAPETDALEITAVLTAGR